ncbi:MAG: hypothetical protein JO037_14455 [Actinobacteria bacterium]|nr:hypothetical protein [Actinomycetota bacterium]
MGMPASSFDALVEQTRVAARRRRRRRRQRYMLWLLTLVTTAVLAAIGLFVVKLAKIPAAASPAALSASARTVSSGTAAARRASPHGQRPAAYPRLTDAAAGLSYRLLGPPWRHGCPSDLNTPAFNWSAGENAVAGHIVIGGSAVAWHGLACSGQLQPQFAYAGPADLQPTATSLVGALDPAYYAGVPHSRTVEISYPMRVSGHQAWLAEFRMNYPDGANQGLTWTSELGAVVVTDRGTGQAPAVFYVSVPANLGIQDVTTLVNSLRVS